jgi:hypothetical protein
MRSTKFVRQLLHQQEGEARTAGHNQVRAKLTSLLLRCLPKQQWKLFEETPMRRTGLELQQVSVA